MTKYIALNLSDSTYESQHAYCNKSQSFECCILSCFIALKWSNEVLHEKTEANKFGTTLCVEVEWKGFLSSTFFFCVKKHY